MQGANRDMPRSQDPRLWKFNKSRGTITPYDGNGRNQNMAGSGAAGFVRCCARRMAARRPVRGDACMSRHELEPNEAMHGRAAALMDEAVKLHRLKKTRRIAWVLQRGDRRGAGPRGGALGKGFEMSCLGRHGEAIPCFEEALKIDPDLAEAHYEKGCSLSRPWKVRRGRGVPWKGDEAEAGSCHAHYEKGFALSRLKRHGEAVWCLDAAISLKPDDAVSHVAKGIALRSLKKHDEAMLCLDEAARAEARRGRHVPREGDHACPAWKARRGRGMP